MIESTYRPLWCLRWLAAVLVRGPNAPFITQDLEEMYARDRTRGASGVAGARALRALPHCLGVQRVARRHVAAAPPTRRVARRQAGVPDARALPGADHCWWPRAGNRYPRRAGARPPHQRSQRTVAVRGWPSNRRAPILGRPGIRQPKTHAVRLRTLEGGIDLVRDARRGAYAKGERDQRRRPG